MANIEQHKLLVYSLLIAIGITGGLGDIWIYKWAKIGGVWWLTLSCTIWLVSLILFGLLLRLDSRAFSAAFMISTVFHVVLVIVCDFIYFGQRLSKLEWIGIILAAIAVILLELGREQSPEEQSNNQRPAEAHQFTHVGDGSL